MSQSKHNGMFHYKVIENKIQLGVAKMVLVVGATTSLHNLSLDVGRGEITSSLKDSEMSLINIHLRTIDIIKNHQRSE